MSVDCLGYLGFRVKDPAAWGDFATRVLGLMPAEAAEGVYRFRMDDHAWRIAVEAGTDDDIAFIGLQVTGPAELEEMSRRLVEAGVAIRKGDPDKLAERGVLGLIACEDPDGLSVEIYYGPTLRTELPFKSPAGIARFLTDEQGAGHVVFATENIAASRNFYEKVLGFRLSDIISIRMGANQTVDTEFYHCNPRHHTLALMPRSFPKRLHHFMIQASSIDEVGHALQRAEAAGTLITKSLGRHSNDEMLSFYAQTPAGFDVEFGYGAIEIDGAWQVVRHDKPSAWGHKRPGA